MIDFYKIKEWGSWESFRAHLCTMGVAVGLQATWRSPRDAFRFGGFQYGLALTVAMLVVALPLALLHLAIGQLSQQDAIGVWRAVPFFRGIGYIKMIISFLAAIYSSIYLSLTITYFFHAISNSLPFMDCAELLDTETGLSKSLNAAACLDETFMAPVSEKPEYYINVAFILLSLWIVFPFIFYNPVKLMKRIIYVSGPIVIILTIVTMSCIGNSMNLTTIITRDDWRSFLEPNIWHGAFVQALLSSQIASGYLISASDIIYSNTNVVWTATAFIGANIVSSWVGLLFWYSISVADKDTTVFAVLIETYKIGEQAGNNIEWPTLIFFILILSGLITMLTLLFPLYDHCRRIAGVRWRVASMSGSLVGACVSVGLLALRHPVLTLLDDYAIPMLVSISVVPEILALVFIYDWRVLMEDVGFLTGQELSKYWAMGWCVAPFIISSFTVWWVTMIFLRDDDWTDPPWPAIALIVTVALAFIVVLILATIMVAKQVQYDVKGKLISSFRPARHWGPRDPITHYYWLARRHELDAGGGRRSRFHRRQLGQLNGRLSFLQVTYPPENINNLNTEKKRSNSDDWLYTAHRKQIINIEENVTVRERSKSLDLNYPNAKAGQFLGLKQLRFVNPEPVKLQTSNNNRVS